MPNPTTTIKEIYNKRPCATGFSRLLASMRGERHWGAGPNEKVFSEQHVARQYTMLSICQRNSIVSLYNCIYWCQWSDMIWLLDNIWTDEPGCRQLSKMISTDYAEDKRHWRAIVIDFCDLTD